MHPAGPTGPATDEEWIPGNYGFPGFFFVSHEGTAPIIRCMHLVVSFRNLL